MLLGGLWHGASWNFVLWGGLHGVALAGHRFYRRRSARPRPSGRRSAWLDHDARLHGALLDSVPRGARRRHRCSSSAACSRTPAARRRFRPETIYLALALVVPGASDRAVPRPARRVRAGAGPGIAPSASRAQTSRPIPISGWAVRVSTRTLVGVFLVPLWVLVLLLSAETHARPFIYFQF